MYSPLISDNNDAVSIFAVEVVKVSACFSITLVPPTVSTLIDSTPDANEYGKIISLAEYYIQITNQRKNWEKNPNLKDIKFLPNSDRSNYTLQHDSIFQKIQKAAKKGNRGVFDCDDSTSTMHGNTKQMQNDSTRVWGKKKVYAR